MKHRPKLYVCDPARAVLCRKDGCMYRPEVRQKDCGWTFLPECAKRDQNGNCIAAPNQPPESLSDYELAFIERHIAQERERYRMAAENHKEAVK